MSFKARPQHRNCCHSCYKYRKCELCKTFNGDRGLEWCNFCNARIALWCSSCHPSHILVKQMCVQHQHSDVDNFFCRNGCIWESGKKKGYRKLALADRGGLCWLCFRHACERPGVRGSKAAVGECNEQCYTSCVSADHRIASATAVADHFLYVPVPKKESTLSVGDGSELVV